MSMNPWATHHIPMAVQTEVTASVDDVTDQPYAIMHLTDPLGESREIRLDAKVALTLVVQLLHYVRQVQ